MGDMDDRLRALLAERNQGVLTTLKRDGRPQLSNVSYTFADGVVRMSVTAGRAKTRNLSRDPRASFYVCAPDFRSYAVAEGTAQLTPVATAVDDATVDELVAVYRAIAGEHPDWDEYRTAMVADQRLVVRIPVDRVYGMA
ncbi:PPOX class F420-dependent oxidoreductase [Actinophytocola sp. KF-1]